MAIVLLDYTSTYSVWCSACSECLKTAIHNDGIQDHMDHWLSRLHQDCIGNEFTHARVAKYMRRLDKATGEQPSSMTGRLQGTRFSRWMERSYAEWLATKTVASV